MVMSLDEAVTSLSSMDAALDLAHGLLKLGKDGLGKQSGATVWEVHAVVPLAVILFAAGPLGCGEGEPWVRAAIDNADPEDTVQPGWARAALLCITVHPHMARSVARLTGLSQRQRDCLVMALRMALDESPGTLAGTARI
ncbi:hypothetical protein A4X20_28860 [Mycolicibacterium iranicum]|jgi:hypothetical protein|nr:hypothetical protein A4X20_28860 [Mycolicibacterium iranicum]